MNGVSMACPAKINLFLRILAREDSGYHQIETLFQAVGLYDRVDVHAGTGEGLELEVRPGATDPGLGHIAAELGRAEDNTVVRAARAFFAATGIAPSARLVLTKAIPAGTGLGGASSDAAGTLAALNALHGEPLTSAGNSSNWAAGSAPTCPSSAPACPRRWRGAGETGCWPARPRPPGPSSWSSPESGLRPQPPTARCLRS